MALFIPTRGYYKPTFTVDDLDLKLFASNLLIIYYKKIFPDSKICSVFWYTLF